MRILLVDDEEHVLRAMVRVFRRLPQHELVAVGTSGDAIEQLGAARFDVAMVDHHLAGDMNGTTLLGMIGERWPTVRRVLCSGGAFNSADVVQSGCAHVLLLKPATLDELARAVEGESRTAAA